MNVRYRNKFILGSLIRKRTIANIKYLAFSMDLELKIEEIYRGWIESTYVFSVIGETNKVETFVNKLRTIFKELE